MGDHQHCHKYYQHQRTTFLPMLCPGPSMKDVSLPRWRKNRATPFLDEPLSPRIGCMGQVKRNNKIVSSHNATTTTITSSAAVVVKYSKLRKIFSAKNLSTTTTPPDRNRNEMIKRCGNSVSIDEMDPPLPVIKRVQEREAESLWKRRSGGAALKTLQLQQVHHTTHRLLHPTSV